MIKVETILVGGMMQSGSHLLFNLIRILLEELECGVKIRVAGNPTGYVKEATNNNRTFVLDREHFFNHSRYSSTRHALDYCVLSYRDPRDTASSWSLKNGEKKHGSILGRVGENIKVFESYNCLDSNKLLKWRYEDYKRALIEEKKENLYDLFSKLVSFLSLQNERNTKKSFNLLVDKIVFEAETEIDRAWNSAGPLNEKGLVAHNTAHWKKTSLVQKVRTSNKGKIGGFRDHLSPELIDAIESKCEGWLKEHGYMK